MSYRNIAWPAGVCALVIGIPVWAYGKGYGPDMMWGNGWMWRGGMPFSLLGILMMLILFSAVIMFAALVVRWLAVERGAHEASGAQHVTKPSALEILEKRFARGEIDEDEFEARKRRLSD